MKNRKTLFRLAEKNLLDKFEHINEISFNILKRYDKQPKALLSIVKNSFQDCKFLVLYN